MRQRIAFRRIGVEEFEARRGGDALLLDVRDAATFAQAHVVGAVHVSHANISSVLSNTAKDRPILIYCYHGNASQEYAQIFSDFGFAEVCSLDGGYDAWIHRPQPALRPPCGDIELQQWLIQQQFPPSGINAVIANATTPLMRAAHLGNTDITRRLLTEGAGINARNADGNNAIWFACVGRHLEVIDQLVVAGIDIDNRNDNGATPLMYAASAGLADIVERLLARGANTEPETLDGFTALDMAATIECLTLLRRAG